MKITLEREKNATKYCAKCGSEINVTTKKCIGCGKQFFRLQKVTLLRCAVAVIVLALIGLNVYRYVENKRTVELVNSKLISMTESKDNYMLQSDKLAAKLSLKDSELAFWNKYAVICTTEGYKYHRYGCGHIEGRNFYIYNIDQAISLGYTPCLDCCDTSMTVSEYIEKYGAVD